MSNKTINDVQDPLGMNRALKISQHVVIPGELATWCRERAGVGAHLALKRESQVIRIAEVEVAGQVNVLKHLQVPVCTSRLSSQTESIIIRVQHLY